VSETVLENVLHSSRSDLIDRPPAVIRKSPRDTHDENDECCQIEWDHLRRDPPIETDRKRATTNDRCCDQGRDEPGPDHGKGRSECVDSYAVSSFLAGYELRNEEEPWYLIGRVVALCPADVEVLKPEAVVVTDGNRVQATRQFNRRLATSAIGIDDGALINLDPCMVVRQNREAIAIPLRRDQIPSPGDRERRAISILRSAAHQFRGNAVVNDGAVRFCVPPCTGTIVARQAGQCAQTMMLEQDNGRCGRGTQQKTCDGEGKR